ncbi:MAG: SUMF1/EgtB/PvdO family nonheme iron enzyme, partial [Chthoniobacteraceae bacterium]
DIYSLGKVLYEMAMGKDRLDFPQVNTDLAEFPDKRELLRLNDVLLQACASDPAQRYGRAEEMRDDLVRIRAGKPLAARSRRRRLLMTLFLVLAALAGAGVWLEREQAARGSVVITSKPLGATVQIGDKAIHAPARFDRLREGSHEMTVTLADYDTVTKTIEVFADEERTLPIVELNRSTGGLQLSGQPRGATFELRRGNDVIESRGFPATLTALPTGAYEVVARYDGEEKRVPVEIKHGEVFACAIEFRFGTVNASSDPPGAELTVDGKVAGTTPQTLTLLEGEHTLTASYHTWPPQTRTIKVDAVKPGTEKFEFQFGSVKFTSYPTGATIRSAGQDIGTTNEVISDVEPGENIYELHLAGYQTLPLHVQVKPGEQAFAPGRFSSRVGPQRGQPWKNSLGMEFVPVGDILMSVWETRVQDYEEFCRITQRARPVPPFEENSERPSEHPVVSVNWDDGREFCDWLTKKELGEEGLVEGQQYRLPTDLEWSRGAGVPDEGGSSPQDRDGKIHEYFWGNDWPPPREAGNFADLPVRNGKPVIPGNRDGHIYTAPVGSFPANANGLFDMAGNVWEWCLEPYRPDSHWGVLRGGSWVTSKDLELYVSYRNVVDRSDRDVIFGFRVVLVPDGAL